jgi:hypothetical protein
VRTDGVDQSAFRYINKALEDVEVCRVSLEIRVLVLDVPHILNEDTLIRPHLLEINLVKTSMTNCRKQAGQ